MCKLLALDTPVGDGAKLSEQRHDEGVGAERFVSSRVPMCAYLEEQAHAQRVDVVGQGSLSSPVLSERRQHVEGAGEVRMMWPELGVLVVG